MKKKEFLIIFILAALLTGLSWFKEGIIKNFCLIPVWEILENTVYFCRGFPIGFNPGFILNKEIIWQHFYLRGIIANFLFWFLVLVGGWLVGKKLKINIHRLQS